MFVMSTLIEHLLNTHDWKNTFIILAGCLLNCAVLGALMRPLAVVDETNKIQQCEENQNIERNRCDKQLMGEGKKEFFWQNFWSWSLSSKYRLFSLVPITQI